MGFLTHSSSRLFYGLSRQGIVRQRHVASTMMIGATQRSTLMLGASSSSTLLHQHNNNNNNKVQYFSSATSACQSPITAKLGLGGNNWSRMEPGRYQNIVEKSMEHGISVLEAGQEGGDQALLEAFQLALHKLNDNAKPVTMTLRIGYRTVMPNTDNNQNNNSQQQAQQKEVAFFPGDVAVEQHPFLGPNRTMTPLDDEELALRPPSNGAGDNKMIQILHNTGDAYIQHELLNSPLVQEYQNESSPTAAAMRLVALLHNPEAQIMALANEQDINKVTVEDRQEFLRNRLVGAFCSMENAVSRKQISSYGVASNGLCLPPEHPLFLSINTVLEAAKIATEKTSKDTKKCHLSVIQLPINLMERTGLDIARDLHEKLQNTQNDEFQHLRDDPPLEIYAMRPLTCYPDRGTGTGHAFRLVDYLLPSGPKDPKDEVETSQSKDGEVQDVKEDRISDEDMTSKQWSNQMQGPPIIYSIALKKAMAHFDAEAILEQKMQRELTAEERETLDGCKLLQSMLHDLDVGLSKVRSLGAHEQDLCQRIIPLIHDTFEGYDEETADVLQMFFKAYSLAVRYSIARNTRTLLQQGGDDGKDYKHQEIPEDEKLQDYALKYLLKDKAISKVIVGATKPDHVVEIAKLCKTIEEQSEQD